VEPEPLLFVAARARAKFEKNQEPKLGKLQPKNNLQKGDYLENISDLEDDHIEQEYVDYDQKERMTITGMKTTTQRMTKPEGQRLDERR